jgi:RNA polymerase sigma factor (sigma-70 family)
VATEEEQQRVADAIKALPMRLRRVFVMRHVLRKPREEIAAKLHISARQVDRRLTVALAACRRRLEVR